MDLLIPFFENIPTVFRAAILIGGLFFFWVLEGVFPLFALTYPRYRHAGLNLFFTATTMLVGFGLAGALLWVSDYVADNRFGLLYLIELPLWAQMIVGVLLLDAIGAYFIHWLEHKVKWMWQFHVVHHSDRNVDVTTGLRHHPGETLFRIVFTIGAVVVVGAPVWLVMLYQSMSVLWAHITHANITLPTRIDNVLSWVFVTPLMHKVHHHFKQPLTDTNYGNIFSIWDRLFGTYARVADSRSLCYGIDTYPEEKEHARLGRLLKMPFDAYRAPGTELQDANKE